MLADLRAACARHGYTADWLAGRLGRFAGPPYAGPALRRLRLGDGEPAALLARLLLLGDALERSAAGAVLAPADVDGLIAAGLLAADDGHVRGLYKIEPCDGLLIASDHFHTSADVVAGVSPSAMCTAWLTPRRRVGTLLDLGTGCGIQALFGARHSDQVLGVDINPRALTAAELSAGLNSATNISYSRGSWFEPVEDDRFDLIVTNPPYAISPDREFLFRDSGMPPAALVRELIGETPAHLHEGGIAQVMLNWSHPPGPKWVDPVGAWLERSGCDALVLRLAVEDPISYATQWNLPRLRHGSGAFEEEVARWVAYYRANAIESISIGAVFMRRRSAAENWIVPLDAGGAPTAPAGDHVLRLFDAYDRLHNRDGADWLLDERPELVPGHRIEQTLTHTDGRYHSHPAVVRVTPGLDIRAAISPDALPVLFRCDGRHTLGELAGDDPSVRSLVSAAARELLAAGLLTF